MEELAFNGLKKRYPNNYEDVSDRLKYEISIIKKMGFVDYFLIVADFIRFAKDNSIPVGPGRGSAAGSLVAYALEITDIDHRAYTLSAPLCFNKSTIRLRSCTLATKTSLVYSKMVRGLLEKTT